MTTVIDEIAAERRRQIEVEGWTAEHDDQHRSRELATAAACYILWGACNPNGAARDHDGYPPVPGWPWAKEWWKPTTPRRDLIKAAAMIVAEIERIDRLRPATKAKGTVDA